MNKNILLVLVILISTTCPAQVDTTIGLTAPKSIAHDYQDLAHYLCDRLSGDRQKANAIYNWITHNIKYDIKGFQKGDIKHPKIEKVLKTRTTMCEGYSLLFVEMCREMGMKAVLIDGYAKDWVFDNGDKMFIPRHGWCAVLVDGQWQLADPTWGAGGIVQAPGPIRRILNKITRKKITYSKRLKFKFAYKPQYFLQDPAEFKLKHLPADPLWQLADTVMPLAIFEAGDSAIRKFNAGCKSRQVNPELNRISELPDEQRTFEAADRSYEFNKRYPVVLALKNTYRAESEVGKALTDSTVTDWPILVKDAVASLKKSEGYVKEQKKAFPDEYSELKKKNKTKSQLAKQDIRKIKTDAKRLMAESKKFVKTAKSKTEKLTRKAGKAAKRAKDAYPEKIDGIETAKLEKKPNSPELKTLTDSIIARDTRIQDLGGALNVLTDKLGAIESSNRKRLDSLATNIDLADSVLILETRARLSMSDNYDDDVILCMQKFDEYKYHNADTLQKYYLVWFDTIDKMHESKQKIQLAQMDMYKQNLRSMEQYKKWSSDNTDLRENYKTTVNKYLECINNYNEGIRGYVAYLKGNRKLFEFLAKVDKKEITLADYMDKAENTRKAVEERTLVKKQKFDMDENKKQEVAIKNIREQLDKANVH